MTPGSFETTEDFLKYLREHADDMDRVEIAVPATMIARGPNGEQIKLNNVCGKIVDLNGRIWLIHREHLEEVLNDGILSRNKIPVKLVPPA